LAASPAAEEAGPLRLEHLRVVLVEECSGVLGGEERTAGGVGGGEEGREDGADSGSGDNVEEVGNAGGRIAGFGLDLVLEVDKEGGGDNGGGSAAVDAENPRLLGFVDVVGTAVQPLLLELRKYLHSHLAQLH